MSPNKNIEKFRQKLNEIEKNFNNNNEDSFFTTDMKIMKSKTFYQNTKSHRNISPNRIEETAKKTYQNPPSYSK